MPNDPQVFHLERGEQGFLRMVVTPAGFQNTVIGRPDLGVQTTPNIQAMVVIRDPESDDGMARFVIGKGDIEQLWLTLGKALGKIN